MDETISITRRTNYVGHESSTQQDVEYVMSKVSTSQNSMFIKLRELIAEIFSSYVKSRYSNNKHIQLLKSYYLLQNLVSVNGDFVNLIKNKNEAISSKVQLEIDRLLSKDRIETLGINYNIPNIVQNKKKLYDEILAIISDLVDEYIVNWAKTHKTTEQTQKSGEVPNQTKRNEETKQSKTSSSKQPKKNDRLVISNVLTSIIRMNLFKQNNKDKSKTSQAGTITQIGLINDRGNANTQTKPKIKNTMSGVMLINKMVEKLQSDVPFTEQFSELMETHPSLKKTMNAFKKTGGVFSNIFNRTAHIIKSVSSSIFNGAKNIVGGVIKSVNKVIKTFASPFMPVFMHFLFSSSGGYMLGWAVGNMIKNIKQLGNFVHGIKVDVKETIGNFLQAALYKIETIEQRIKPLIDYVNINYEFLINSGKEQTKNFLDLIRQVLDSFTPSGIIKNAGMYALGAATSYMGGRLGLSLIGRAIPALAPKAAGLGLGLLSNPVTATILGVAAVAAIGGIIWYQWDKRKKKKQSSKFSEATKETLFKEQQEEFNKKLSTSTRISTMPKLYKYGASKKARSLAVSQSGELDTNEQDLLDEIGTFEKRNKIRECILEFVARKREDLDNEREALKAIAANENREKLDASAFSPLIDLFINNMNMMGEGNILHANIGGSVDYMLQLRGDNLIKQYELLAKIMKGGWTNYLLNGTKINDNVMNDKWNSIISTRLNNKIDQEKISKASVESKEFMEKINESIANSLSSFNQYYSTVGFENIDAVEQMKVGTSTREVILPKPPTGVYDGNSSQVEKMVYKKIDGGETFLYITTFLGEKLNDSQNKSFEDIVFMVLESNPVKQSLKNSNTAELKNFANEYLDRQSGEKYRKFIAAFSTLAFSNTFRRQFLACFAPFKDENIYININPLEIIVKNLNIYVIAGETSGTIRLYYDGNEISYSPLLMNNSEDVVPKICSCTLTSSTNTVKNRTGQTVEIQNDGHAIRMMLPQSYTTNTNGYRGEDIEVVYNFTEAKTKFNEVVKKTVENIVKLMTYYIQNFMKNAPKITMDDITTDLNGQVLLTGKLRSMFSNLAESAIEGIGNNISDGSSLDDFQTEKARAEQLCKEIAQIRQESRDRVAEYEFAKSNLKTALEKADVNKTTTENSDIVCEYDNDDNMSQKQGQQYTTQGML